MKANRQKVFDKYGGRCAYCGCELTGKWHIDHLEPVFRNHKLVRDEQFNYVRKFDGYSRPQNLNGGNEMPSCVSCNNYKSTYDLETFRQEVGLLVGRLNKTFTIYKIAKRYGLIEETNKKVLFYFETLNKELSVQECDARKADQGTNVGNQK